MKWLLIGILLLGAILIGVGLRGGKGVAVNCIGSTSIQPFAEVLSQDFNADPKNLDCLVDVQGGGSAQGITKAEDGTADLGMCSRNLKPEEAAILTPITIARNGLAIIVHESNPITGLTRVQVRQIFAGQIHNWNQVGGPDLPIQLITREEGSGTREAFTKMVMDAKTPISRRALTQPSNGAVKELVKTDPRAIGYMSLGLVEGVKPLTINGVRPTADEVKAGRYPLVRPFLFVTKGPPSAKAQRFVDYVLSAEGQKTLEREGLVGTIKAETQPAPQGEEAVGAP
jgi:phosphate transport system substrate-binding protein